MPEIRTNRCEPVLAANTDNKYHLSSLKDWSVETLRAERIYFFPGYLTWGHRSTFSLTTSTLVPAPQPQRVDRIVRLAWMTDLHLDHAAPEARERLMNELVASGADAAVVTGDTGEARTFGSLLFDMAQAFHRPLYFVLGNHDCYRDSIKKCKSGAGWLARASSTSTTFPKPG